MRYLCCCTCFYGSHGQSKVTLIFNVIMLLSAILKLSFQANLTAKIEEDLTEQFETFSGFFVVSDLLIIMDIALYFMMIVVAAGTLFTWFPH